MSGFQGLVFLFSVNWSSRVPTKLSSDIIIIIIEINTILDSIWTTLLKIKQSIANTIRNKYIKLI